ncbi:unnamed protein product [Paramecium octaurelia]|uniref:Transmembrane protein n=1 Tax=Paramecium octaurelia TaxID=43137 RepID=A0A8S1YM14_PAROT|nr:unnamed protein product [Paramecium octaurelia]
MMRVCSVKSGTILNFEIYLFLISSWLNKAYVQCFQNHFSYSYARGILKKLSYETKSICSFEQIHITMFWVICRFNEIQFKINQKIKYQLNLLIYDFKHPKSLKMLDLQNINSPSRFPIKLRFLKMIQIIGIVVEIIILLICFDLRCLQIYIIRIPLKQAIQQVSGFMIKEIKLNHQMDSLYRRP